MLQIFAALVAFVLSTLPAQSQLMQMTGAGLGSAAVAPSFSLDYVTNVNNPDNCWSNGGNICTDAAVNIGADVAGDDVRYTIVVIGGIPSSTANWTWTAGGTICGVSSTLIAQAAANDAATAIFLADTTGAGTSCTITTANSFGSSSPAATQHTIGVYRMVNPASATASATVCDLHASGVTTLSIDVPAGGAAVGVAENQNGGSFTWVGLAEDYDIDSLTTDFATGAHGSTAGTPLTITATGSDTTPTEQSGCSASWDD